MKDKSTVRDYMYVIGEAIVGIVSMGLIIAGFIIPPPGVIDPSVLSAVGELMGFAAIWMLPSAIRAGKTIKWTKGDHTITVSGEENKEE